ncbi:hypothetical protein C8R32_12210 [Nitrosospira sp. Nsp5]|uniref:Uncharacterized protein n=1 Tax=Nitrosospira multiformis TaxID=1231 RepID=A0ABY0TIR4_9PROT|nr:hypothetical protein C8R32_12210 [Nitrosospira sp. Nsp5]SDQ90278.1 hypothetical protein SAMN05216402_2755 [Nitrosospira multiformis]
MEFSSPQRSLKWVYEPARRFLQSSSSGTYYLNRPEFVKMIFGLLSPVLRISQSQIPVAGKCVTTPRHQGDLRIGLVCLHVGRSNTDRPKYSTGTTYYRNTHSIRSVVQLTIISNPIATCTNPWFSSRAFLKDLSR